MKESETSHLVDKIIRLSSEGCCLSGEGRMEKGLEVKCGRGPRMPPVRQREARVTGLGTWWGHRCLLAAEIWPSRPARPWEGTGSRVLQTLPPTPTGLARLPLVSE